MKRKDKEITDPKEIEEVLSANVICRIALTDGDEPYVFPINYGYKDNKIYLHTSHEGRKMEIIKRNNNVCFEITDFIEIIESEKPCDFGTRFRSVIGSGKIKTIDDRERKREALKTIMFQHTGRGEWEIPDEKIDITNILEIEITDLSGKRSGR